MKNGFPFFLIVLCFFFTLHSCSTDIDILDRDEDTAMDDDSPMDMDTSFSNSDIRVLNSTEISSDLPTPNSTIDFEVNTSLTQAFQSTGFTIEFDTQESFNGAFVQFTDVNGNPTDTYFDVTPTEQPSEEFNNLIEVEFGPSIPAGEFCYIICLYDEENNIFQAETVCINVLEWGGNDEIIGEWKVDRIEPNDDIATIDCSNGVEVFTAPYDIYTKRDQILIFGANGEYGQLEDSEFMELDFSSSRDACSPIYREEVIQHNDRYDGYWAFNDDTGSLTGIAFEFTDFLDPSNDSTDEVGLVMFETTKTELIDGQLVLTVEDIDGTITAYLDRL